MDLSWFAAHNSHLENPEGFSEQDIVLRALKNQPLIYSFTLLEKLPIDTPGIFTLCGAHQSGKTTLLKNWIAALLKKSIPPETIAFFAGSAITNYHVLHQVLKKQLLLMPNIGTLYLIIDDITFIRDFEKAILPLKESGLLNRVMLLLSGADIALIQSGPQKSFHLFPLSFRETVLLKQKNTEPSQNILYEEFNDYLIHGGNLNAINNFVSEKKVSDKTLLDYGNWIFKEVVRANKQERFLRDILKSIFNHYNEQITWNGLAPELSIDHPKTIGDYFSFLETREIIFVQGALSEKTLDAAPKKARKTMFMDPFLFHAMNAWLHSGKNFYESQVKETLADAKLSGKLVEGCVATQFKRFFPTFYIKEAGEVNVAYINDKRFWPVETTWNRQIRMKDLKQILKYSNGRILTKTDRSGIIEHIKTEPLPQALWQLGDTNLQ